MFSPEEVAKIVLDRFNARLEGYRAFVKETENRLPDEQEEAVHLMKFADEPWLRTILLGETGCKVLGSGAARIALQCGEDKVIKVEFTKYDPDVFDFIGQNQREINLWENASFPQTLKLAPIYEHGKDWLVMAKTEPPFDGCDKALCEELASITDDPSMATYNTGMYKGRAVLHDYGYLTKVDKL